MRHSSKIVIGLLAAMSLGACRPKQTIEAPAPAPPPPPKVYPEPPPPTAAKPVAFPETEVFTLSNGLTVYLVRNTEVPLVNATLAVRCGDMDEAYVASFTADLLSEGTQSRAKAQIDDAIEFVGGTLSSASSTHVSYVQAESLSKDLLLAMTLMGDEVLHPLLSEEALSKLKEQAKAGLAIAKSSPDTLADQLFAHIAYPEGHPYGRPLPTNAEIDAVTIDDIRAFHKTFYRANNAFLVLSGDVTRQQAETLASRVFGGWPSAKADEIPPNPLNRFKDYQPASELVIHIVDRPGSTSTAFRIGNLAIARAHADWSKLEVANRILGRDPSARLFMDIRENQGLVYGVWSDVTQGQAPGMFEVQGSTRVDTTGAVVLAVFDHIKRMRADLPSEEELAAAKAKIVGGFPRGLETPEAIARKLREQVIFELPNDYWSTYRDQIEGVTAVDVQEVARKYMHGAPHVVLVGDGEVITEQIQEVLPSATIRHYGLDLRPMGD